MFTYESTSFEWEGFLLVFNYSIISYYIIIQVLSASVVTGLRWSTAQLTIQKEDLGKYNYIHVSLRIYFSPSQVYQIL